MIEQSLGALLHQGIEEGWIEPSSQHLKLIDSLQELGECLIGKPPEATSWDGYITLTREWLTHYPEDTFTGVSGDPGALFVVAIREALKELDNGH